MNLCPTATHVLCTVNTQSLGTPGIGTLGIATLE